MVQNIKDWDANERPREKLLLRGAEVLSNAELLAIFIGSGTKEANAVDIGRTLLVQFGSLRAVMQADQKLLCTVKGIGKNKYVLLRAAKELACRILLEKIQKKDVMSNPRKAREYLSLKMQAYEHEVFACLFLDSQQRVIKFEEMFRGTIDGSTVHIREVVKRALHHNAAAIIMAHNHPSGSHEPSRADEEITQEMKRALAMIDVRVLDHFVVGEKVTSFAERDLL